MQPSFHLKRFHNKWVHDIYGDILSRSVAANIYFPLTSNNTVVKIAGIARIIESKRLNETIWIGLRMVCVFFFGLCQRATKIKYDKITVIWCQFFFVDLLTFFVVDSIESFKCTCFPLHVSWLESNDSTQKKAFYIIQWNRR